MANQADILVPVYCITKLAPDCVADVEKSLLTSKGPESDQPNEEDAKIRPRFVPWEKVNDGNDQDILRLYQQVRGQESSGLGDYPHIWILDQQSVDDGTVLMVGLDEDRLLYLDEAMEELSNLLEERNSVIPEWDFGLSDRLAEIMMDRGLTYARIPATSFRGAEQNLAAQNMGISELAEFAGATVMFIPDPDWDASGFVERAEKVYKKMREEYGHSKSHAGESAT